MARTKIKTETLITHEKVADMITKGHTRKYIVDKLMEDGVEYSNAAMLYYRTLKDLIPNPDFYEDYKRGVVQQNLDRLDRIIEQTISGDTADKNVAIKAIETINKMVGAYGENQVNIAKNKEGDEIIQITFNK